MLGMHLKLSISAKKITAALEIDQYIILLKLEWKSLLGIQRY